VAQNICQQLEGRVSFPSRNEERNPRSYETQCSRN
jgi:hypothetical protein